MFDNFTLKNTKTGNQVEFNFEEGETPTPTPSGDVSNSTVAFTEAQTRANISTGEKLSVICGKIKKFFADLKAVAFSGSYNDLTDKPNLFSGDYNDLSNKPSIPTVNNATLTIKQGGTTKGTFTANASTDVEVDLDAGGGGGSTYTAGAGIDITNNVISVTNAIVKTDISIDDAVIPCLFQDTNPGEDAPLTKEDGTTATLADCLDLGASTLNIGAQFLKYINNVHVSGSAKAYDYGTQKQTTLTYNEDINSGTSQVYNSGIRGLFDESVQIIGGSVTSEHISLQIVLGKANGHLYAFVYNNYFGTLSEQSYISSCTCTADVEFTQI